MKSYKENQTVLKLLKGFLYNLIQTIKDVLQFLNCCRNIKLIFGCHSREQCLPPVSTERWKYTFKQSFLQLMHSLKLFLSFKVVLIVLMSVQMFILSDHYVFN